MSRRLYAFSAIISVAPLFLTGAQVSVDSATLSPGSSGVVAISLAGLGDHVSGLQFDMVYDSSVLNINAVTAGVTRSAAKNVYYMDQSSGAHRILLVGLNQNLFADGPVFSLFVNTSVSGPAGSYPITVTNIVATDPTGVPLPISDASGIVTVAGSVGDVSPIQAGGILNAASLVTGAVSPGELIALIGSSIGPATPANLQVVGGNSVSTTLGNTQVTFDGTPVPLIYAGPNQVNAIVPYEIANKATTQVSVLQGGNATPALAIPVAAVNPAIFTQNSSGTGQAAALNQDSTLNTPFSVAPAGSIIAVYMTGTGQANPTQITGRINGPSDTGTTLQTVTATVGGLPADVVYAGPAPALVAGATQVNIRIPAGIIPSLAAPLSIQVGNIPTKNDVVVSVGAAAAQ